LSLDTAQTEVAVEFARMIGDVYSSVVDGIGDSSTPGSAIFELSQLQSLNQNGVPLFGVVEDAVSTFLASYTPSDQYFVQIAAGVVGYQGQLISVPPQRIPLRRTYGASFDSTYQFHVAIGLPIAEMVKSSTLWTTVTSAQANSGTTTIPVQNAAIAANLGFPLQAHIGTSFIVFSGVTPDGSALQIDPSFDSGVAGANRYGTLSATIAQGTSVIFIYQPTVSAVYGMPVVSNVTDLADFHYQVALPTDWLPVASVLVQNPPAPSVVSPSSNVYALTSTLETYPAPNSSTTLFSVGDANSIAKTLSASIAAINLNGAAAHVGDLISSLETMTSQVADTPAQTFNQFWGEQPFRPNSYFSRGVSFFGISRPEFSTGFARAYNALRNADTQHTFAIFRGDLYESQSALVGAPPSPVTCVSGKIAWVVNAPTTGLAMGSYVYGVTAVTSAGESSPTYAIVTTTGANTDFYFNSVSFPIVSDALYYNVYRRSTLVGDQSEYLLTTANQVTGYGTYSLPQLGFGSSLSFNAGSVAFQFTATGTLLSYIDVRLRSDATLTDGTDYVTIGIYPDSSGSPSSTLVPGSSTVTVLYSALTTSLQDFVGQVSATLTNGSTYWIVMTLSAAPVGGNIVTQYDPSGTGVKLKPSSSWSGITATGYFYLYYGFVDFGAAGNLLTSRGMRLTGNTSLIPRRLRVYVAPAENIGRGFSPIYLDVNNNADQVTTPELTQTMNEMLVTVTARNGANGSPTTFSVTVPQNTARGTQFLLGSSTQLFDRVDDVTVSPGATANLRLGSNGAIIWSIYDLVTIETVP
jgi:hypothetical protein